MGTPNDDVLEVWRIFTVADGTTSMEKIDVPLNGAAASGWQSRLFNGTGVIFRRFPYEMTGSWHTAPRRQFIATIQGEAELETGDGQVLVMRPGIVTLVEDVTGQGHITRSRGTQGRLGIFMPVDDDEQLP